MRALAILLLVGLSSLCWAEDKMIDEKQVLCVGEAMIGQATAEARMSKVDRDEFKMQLIITHAQMHDQNTLLAKSAEAGLKNVDWIYDRQLSPKETYIDVYKSCAKRHGKFLTQVGDVLRHFSAHFTR